MWVCFGDRGSGSGTNTNCGALRKTLCDQQRISIATVQWGETLSRDMDRAPSLLSNAYELKTKRQDPNPVSNYVSAAKAMVRSKESPYIISKCAQYNNAFRNSKASGQNRASVPDLPVNSRLLRPTTSSKNRSDSIRSSISQKSAPAQSVFTYSQKVHKASHGKEEEWSWSSVFSNFLKSRDEVIVSRPRAASDNGNNNKPLKGILFEKRKYNDSENNSSRSGRSVRVQLPDDDEPTPKSTLRYIPGQLTRDQWCIAIHGEGQKSYFGRRRTIQYTRI